VRSGAPSWAPPEPRYVWHAVQPATAKSFAPGTAFAGSFSVLIQVGTFAITSEASASEAVAPFQVSTAIERTTSTAPTIATDRRKPDDDGHDDEAHHCVVEHRVGMERLPARLDVLLVARELRAPLVERGRLPGGHYSDPPPPRAAGLVKPARRSRGSSSRSMP